MIFNPLFLSENGSNQILASKSSKLSKNKYLFSDIVKVVMNPVDKQKKAADDVNPVILDNIGLALSDNQTPIKLKLKFLSDSDNEQAKLGLAEILPDEIAELLTSDQENLSSDKAVSYISKDLFKGELQSFVNNLVGAELVSKNISNESGLLLSLEDKKSAVNLELVKNSGKKTVGDKIIVQTLVVPEKAKLLSLAGEENNNLIRLSKGQYGSSVLSNNSTSEIVKPTLSVYSFNYGGDKFESLTKDIKSEFGQRYNFNLLSNKSMGSVKLNSPEVPLEKISVIPSELKKDQLGEKSSSGGKSSKITKQSAELKLFKNNKSDLEKTFTVNKITILKKKGDVQTEKNIKSDNEISPKIIKQGLRKINFNKDLDNNSKQLHLLNKKLNNVAYSKISDDKFSNSKSEVGETQPTDFNLHKTNELNKQETTAKLFTMEKVKRSAQNIIKTKESANINTQKVSVPKISKEINEIKIQHNKEIIINNNEVESKNNSLGNSTNSISSKKGSEILDFSTERGKVNLTSNVNDNKSIGKNKPTKSEATINKTGQSQNDKSFIENNELKVKEAGTIDESKSINSQKITIKATKNESQNIEGSKNSNESQNINRSGETEEKNISKTNIGRKEVFKKGSKKETENISKEKDQKETNPNSDKTTVKNKLASNLSKDALVTSKIYQNLELEKESKVNNLEKSNPKNIDIPNWTTNEFEKLGTKTNKKFSVKVKAGIKSVSDKNESKSSEMKANSESENSSKDNEHKSENNEFNSNRNTSLQNSNFDIKHHSDKGFNSVLHRSEKIAAGISVNHHNNADTNSQEKIVKSIEVIKEISNFISKQEKGSLSFDIKPEHLGKMKVTLDSTDHVVKARIEVENEHAKHLIEKNIDKLNQQLSQSGVKLNSLNISLGYSRQQKTEEGMNSKQHEETQSLDQIGNIEEEQKKKTLGYNTYEYIA